MNTKYIASNVLKISVISRVRSTREIADIFNILDKILLVLTKKRKKNLTLVSVILGAFSEYNIGC